MEDLIIKYKNNSLTPKELGELRYYVNNLSDEQLDEIIKNNWLEDDTDIGEVEEDIITHIRQRIGSLTKNTHNHHYCWWNLYNILKVAALILLPILVISLFFTYKSYMLMGEQMVVFCTSIDEHSKIILPDGSEVLLNEDSELRYSPKNFFSDNRKIDFEGEGYFIVAKSNNNHFCVKTKNTIIQVIGTKFDLKSRSHNNIDELYLEEGNVLLRSCVSGKEVLLSPYQKAFHDKKTGCLTVSSFKNIEEATSWQKRELVFHNTPLSNVLKTLEDHYKVTIHIESNHSDDLFTGSMTSRNLSECLQILEETYHLKTTIKGKQIYFK